MSLTLSEAEARLRSARARFAACRKPESKEAARLEVAAAQAAVKDAAAAALLEECRPAPRPCVDCGTVIDDDHTLYCEECTAPLCVKCAKGNPADIAKGGAVQLLCQVCFDELPDPSVCVTPEPEVAEVPVQVRRASPLTVPVLGAVVGALSAAAHASSPGEGAVFDEFLDAALDPGREDPTQVTIVTPKGEVVDTFPLPRWRRGILDPSPRVVSATASTGGTRPRPAKPLALPGIRSNNLSTYLSVLAAHTAATKSASGARK